MKSNKHNLFRKVLSGVLSAAFVLSGTAAIGMVSTENASLTVNAATTTSSDSPVFSWDNASVYFLLTDRFCNGDTSNDHSYGRGQGKNGASISYDTTGAFQGGDFAGITKKINEGYFDDLGVNAIWLSAPYEQIHGYCVAGDGDSFAHYSYHGYYVLDYTESDKNFGTKEEFKTMVDTAHEHGIRIVMDIVMNHSGYNTLQDMSEYGFGELKSGWDDYYYAHQNINNTSYHGFVNYDSDASVWAKWWGPDWIRCGLPGYTQGSGDIEGSLAGLPDFKTGVTSSVSLPQVLQTKWKKEGTYDAKVAKYGTSDTVTGYISTWLAEWVREFGVDGFRCDTAKHVELSAWKQLKTKCVAALKEWKQANPNKKMDDLDFWMTGECFGHKMAKSNYFTDGGFDSMINFEFAPAVNSSNIPSAGAVEGRYSDYANSINSDPNFNVLSYLASHDTTLIKGDRKYAGSFLLMLPGGIQIYYGDESNRPLETSAKANADPGAGHQLRTFMNWNSLDQDVLSHWQKLGQFRRNHIAVGAGQHTLISAYDSTNGYTFARTYSKNGIDDKVVVTLFASANKDVTIDVSSVWSDGVEITNFYDGTTCRVAGGKVTFNTGANGTILMQEPQGKKGFVTVKHINQDSGETIKTVTMSGLIGDAYTAEALSEPGYTVAKVSGSKTGTYSETEATVTFYYTFDVNNYGYLTVKYVDAATGEELADSETTAGKIGTAYSASPKDIKNYEVDESQTSNATGTYKKGTTTVTFKYNYIEPTNLRVHYYNANNWSSVYLYAYDESGTTVKEFTGKWPGTAMTAESDGWFVADVPDTEAATIIFNNNGTAQEPDRMQPGYDVSGEVWLKNKQIASAGKVSVKYISTDGKVLGSQTLTGITGESYTTSAKSFDNYELTSTPANASGTFTSATITVTYTYKSTVVDDLKMTASVSPTSVKVGSSVTAKASATGGTAPYQYAFFYKKSTDSSWTTAKAYSTTSSVAIKPAKEATYNVCIKVKDSAGTEVKEYINFTSTEDKELTMTGTLSASSVNVGGSVTAKATASGGTSPYKYAFFYKKSTDSQWVTAKDYSTTSSVAIKPAKAATYNVCIKVKDAKSTVVKKYINFTSVSPLTITGTLSATSVNVGGSVTAKATASGGTSPYKYAFFYKKSTDSQWVTAKDYSTTSSVAIKPAKEATYNVCIKVKDAKNTVVKKYINFTSKSGALANTSTLSATSVKLGSSLTVKNSATGGTGSYQYACFYKKVTDKEWTKRTGYTTSTSITLKPAQATVYDVVVWAKDSTGKVVKQYLSFAVNSVTTSLTNTSTISATSVSKGTKLTIKGAASGVSDMALYKYDYVDVSTGKYTTIADYSTSTSKTWTPSAAGTYVVRVTVQDMKPSLAVKTFKVTVK